MTVFLKAVGVILILYLLVLLGVTFVEVRAGPNPVEGLLQLVTTLFSWEIVLGALGAGAGIRFHEEIEKFLKRVGGGANSYEASHLGQ